MLLFPLCVVFLSSMTSLIDAKACTDMKVQPMVDFNMTKFLGLWYAVEGTYNSERCMTYEFEKTANPKQYRVIQSSPGKTKDERLTGNLEFTGEDNKAEMIAYFPPDISNEMSFIVFETDYDTYAGAYTCDKRKVSKGEDATMLSRQPTLSEAHINKLHSRLSQFDVDNSMKKFTEKKCAN